MKLVVVVCCLVGSMCLSSGSSGQGGFLEAPKKLIRIPLREQTNQVKSRKEIFDFISMKQTYFRKPVSEYSEDYQDMQSLAQTKVRESNIKLYNFKNTQFTGLISVGSTENEFRVIFDTGSANLWLDSKKCQNEGCRQHKQYDAKSSPTYRHVGYALDVMFGTGELNGEVNQDTVFVGGVEVEQQDFAEILSETGSVFENSGFDGIVGLAYPKMAAYNFNPLLDNIMKQKKLEYNQFAFYLSAKEGSEQSLITFGGYDPDLMDGTMKYHSVIDKYYWMIKADNILVDGKDVGFCPKGCHVIADTGTSLITGPTDDLLRLLDMINVNDQCKDVEALPKLTFRMGGMDYDLEPQDYVMQMFDNGVESPLSQASSSSFVETGSNGNCIGGFMPLDIPEPQGPAWILGDIFLTKYYSVYDRDTNMVGLGKAIH